jgi:limonene 1,2-monooxygenase
VAGGSAIASPELFIAAAGRTRHIKLGTGVVSLPYHHPLMVTNRMVFLDHMTKARAMLGVGPGALVSDAYMLGIDPPTQRRRMDESLGIIIRLLTETQPITYEARAIAFRCQDVEFARFWVPASVGTTATERFRIVLTSLESHWALNAIALHTRPSGSRSKRPWPT